MMYSGDEDYGDEITSGIFEREWPCNECGVGIPYGDELCAKCAKEEYERDEYGRMHPEERCPTRE